MTEPNPPRPVPGPQRPGPGPAPASPSGAEAPAAASSFTDLDELPVADHVDVYDAEHARLQRELGTIDQL